MITTLRVSLVLSLLLFVLSGCSKEEVTSDQHFANAKSYLEANDSASAIVELKNSLQKDVNNSRARSLLGITYFGRGEYQSAAKELSKAYEKGVDSSLVVPYLAKAWLSLGEFRQLEELRLDNLDPEGRSEVQAAKGLSVLYQGDLVGAEEILNSAMDNDPRAPYAEVAFARLAMAKNEYDTARKRLREIFKSNPEYAPAWNLLGDVESAERVPKKAEKAYTKALEFSPRSFDARLNRVMMRIYQKNFKGAQADLNTLRKQSGAVAKAHPGVHFATGLVRIHSKNLAGARTSFQKAAEFSDAYPLAHYYIAAIDLELGGVEQAMHNVYRFLGLVPGSVVGAKLAGRLELEQQNFEKVTQLLEPVVAALPEDVESLNLLASAYLALGRSGEGVELLAKVAELEPDSAQAKARLGAGYIAAGDEAQGVATLRDIVSVNPEFEQADILIVLNFLRQGKLAEAVTAAEEYRDRNPQSATSYNLLGRAYQANKQLEEAAQAFTKADELVPGDPGANHGLADHAISRGAFDEARGFYEKVLKHHPNHLQTLLRIAGSYAQQGDEKNMIKSLESTIQANPRAMEPRLVQARYYIARGELENAAPLLDELSEEQKRHPDTLVTTAGFELAASRYNQALLTLEELIKLRPNISQYHYLKSKAYAGLGNIEKFTQELRKAVELDPNHFYAKIALARLSHVTNKPEEFQSLLAELKDVAPENPDVKKLEVFSAQRAGDDTTAERLLRELYEESPTTTNMIALAAHREATGGRPRAIALLEHWLDEHPGDVKAREQLAGLHGSNGNIEEVIEQYEEIIDLDEVNVIALNNLSWYLLESKPKDSLEYAQRAYAQAPESVSVMDTLALALLQNERVVEARRILDRALELAPGNPDLIVHEAEISMAEGDNAAALRSLNKALKLKAEFAEREKAEKLLAELSR